MSRPDNWKSGLDRLASRRKGQIGGYGGQNYYEGAPTEVYVQVDAKCTYPTTGVCARAIPGDILADANDAMLGGTICELKLHGKCMNQNNGSDCHASIRARITGLPTRSF